MSISEVLSRFPEQSQFRVLISELASDDAERRESAYYRARDLDHVDSWEAARTPFWMIGEAEAIAILYAVEVLDFPMPDPEIDWTDGLHSILALLWRSPYPSLITSIGRAYTKVNDGRRRSALLTLLGVIGTREAAETFMRCIREAGWPSSAYIRLFEELEKLLAFGDIMLPDVLLSAGRRWSTNVGEAVISVLSNGTLNMDELGDRLLPLAPYVRSSLKKSLKSAVKHQNKPGLEWRYTERYHSIRQRTCMFIDLAGRLDDPKLSVMLRQATEFSDPRIVTFAALGLLRRGEAVEQHTLNIGAASHETRVILFEGLCALGRELDFPSKWRTWDAFAAAKMVEWLLYPTELGREPDELELEHKHWLNDRPTMAVYVWKFRVADGPWMACVSGPHEFDGEPHPVDGSLTFSRFEEWNSATAMEHLDRCAGTAEEILAAHNPKTEEP